MPWPADYGGVIDVYYRIKGLADMGVKVHLHCYAYGREKASVLESLCEEVHYYPREIGMRHQLEWRPYIVASRKSQQLMDNLQRDNYPILLEGLHDCYVLEQLGGGDRKITVRAHNVEHDYYHALADAEHSLWKRVFFRIEAFKLKRYEKVLDKASAILAISEKDAAQFASRGYEHVVVLPPSHGNTVVSSQLGSGDYVLYHGNLSVGENVRAVNYLLDNIVDRVGVRFVVAGRDPDQQLTAKIAEHENVSLVANPDDQTMHQLIRDAHINLLVTDQATGVKLKLINSLYEGRYCLVNSKMVAGTGLEEACVVEDDAVQQIESIKRIMTQDFDEEALRNRIKTMGKVSELSNIKNIIL